MGRRNRRSTSAVAQRGGVAAAAAAGVDDRRAALERVLWWTGIAAAAVVWLALAEPWSRGAVYLVGDLAEYHLPMRQFYADCLAQGHSPHWLPSLFCGYYLHGEGQVGMLHPAHWLAYRLLSLESAFNFELLVNYPLLIAGTYWLLLRRGLPRSAALFAGVLFAYSGFNLTHLMHVNMIAVVAHLPWLLLAIDWTLSDGRPGRVAAGLGLVAILTGSQLLLGHPQSVWLVGLIEVSYVLLLLTSVARWWRVPALVAAKLAGVAIGCAQLWPTWQLLGMSRRETTDAAYRGAWSLHPLNALQTLSPYLFPDRVHEVEVVQAGSHELTWYAGCAVPVLVIWLILRWRSLVPAWRKLVIWAVALAIVGFVLALGRYAGPLHAVVVQLPVVGLFRCPARYGLLTFFGLAVLGGVALADLADVAARGERPSWRRLSWLWLAPAASAVAAVVVTFWLQAWDGNELSTWWERPLTGVVLSMAAAGLITAALRGRPWVLAGTIVLVAGDLGLYGISYAHRVTPIVFAELKARMVRYPSDPQWRLTIGGQLGRGDFVLLTGARVMYGYVGLTPRQRLLSDFGIAKTNPNLLRRLGAVRWNVVDARWAEIEGWLPRARLLGEARVSEDLAADLVRYDPATVALVDEPLELPPNTSANEPGRVDITRDLPGEIDCAVDSPATRLLVLAESWHPGWHVTVDGSPRAIVRTFGDFMGCVVPAGNSHVEFRFNNPVESRANWVSLGGLLASLMLASAGWWKARHDERTIGSAAASA
ncbi:MAG: hypothetical protein AB7U73_01520 [Pirellulales bacterium]